MHARLGRRVRVIVEGPGPATLADLRGQLAVGRDLGTVNANMER